MFTETEREKCIEYLNRLLPTANSGLICFSKHRQQKFHASPLCLGIRRP